MCVVTGGGFKDERSLLRMTGEAPTPLVGSFAAFAQAGRGAQGGLLRETLREGREHAHDGAEIAAVGDEAGALAS